MKQWKTYWKWGRHCLSGPPSLKKEVWYVGKVNGVCMAASSEAMLMLKSCLWWIRIDIAHDSRGKQPVKLSVLQKNRTFCTSGNMQVWCHIHYVRTVYILKNVLSSPPTGTLTQWTSARSTQTGKRWGYRAASPARPAGQSPSQPSLCWRGLLWSLLSSRKEAGKWASHHYFLSCSSWPPPPFVLHWPIHHLSLQAFWHSRQPPAGPVHHGVSCLLWQWQQADSGALVGPQQASSKEVCGLRCDAGAGGVCCRVLRL